MTIEIGIILALISGIIGIVSFFIGQKKASKDDGMELGAFMGEVKAELANIKVNDKRSLVYGAVFGFAPAEIAYFSDAEHRNLAEENKNIKLIKNYGINLTYVLAPDTARQVINRLEQNLRHNQKEM